MQYVLTQETANPSHPIGGKAKALAILRQGGAPVPGWLVVTPDAFFDSLTSCQKEALQKNPEALLSLLEDFRLVPVIQAALETTLASFFQPGQLVAVRSSALDEDHIEYSFAGQFQSFLFVPQEQVVEKLNAVWRSGCSPQVLAYRVSKGLPALPSIPAVLIQQMVDATASGVAFGADPVSGDVNVAVVSAVYGLGTALVSGACDADVFHLHRKRGELQRHIANKKLAARRAPDVPEPQAETKIEMQTEAQTSEEGVVLMPVPPEAADKPCLNESQLALVAQWVRYCALKLGTVQDMEWAFMGNNIYILQSRPVTTSLAGDPLPYSYYWDDDQMDSWGGVTTPLTFSFIRRFYEVKFKHLSRMMGVPAQVIQANAALYRRMLGFIRGRIFFNVASLEEIWAPVPCFQRYRPIFNDWVGINDVNEWFPPKPVPRLIWLKEHWAMVRTLLSLTMRYCRWDKKMAEFDREVSRALTVSACELGKFNMHRLAHHYQRLENVLNHQWAKPTINNFFASLFYTRLGKLTEAWCEDEEGTLRSNLLSGDGDIVSARPIRYLEKLAWLALAASHASDFDLIHSLCHDSLDTILTKMRHAPEFDYHYRRYLLAYGQRCHESSKMESPNIADEPLQLLRSIGYTARRFRDTGKHRTSVDITQPSAHELEIRRQAEATVVDYLAGNSLKQRLKRWCFNWVLRQARDRVRDRENIRFVQTQVMGRLRMILFNLGRCFCELGLLDHPRDVIYLEVEELLGVVESTIACTDLRGLVAVRKAEFERNSQTEDLPANFGTLGSGCFADITEIYTRDGEVIDLAGESETFEIDTEEENKEEAVEDDGSMVFTNGEDILSGISCSPGVIRGPVVFVDASFVDSPGGISLSGGEILVADIGAPGLVMLFSGAAGLLFEKGSPLSHLSIVAREMGIPTIVSVAGVRSWLQEGDWVEMDGKTGLVRKIDVIRKIDPPAADNVIVE